MPMRPESVKRRVLWINDEDWAAIVERATAASKTASVYVRERALAGLDHYPGPSVELVTPAANRRRGQSFGRPRPAPKGK
jgi:hypothetical protein